MTNLQMTTQYRGTLHIVLVNAYAHFRLRVSSWYMAGINLAVGTILTINPGAMTTNPGADVFFGNLLQIAPPEVWRAAFLAIGMTRLLALIVNGTFKRIRWTPYVRAGMAALSAVIWAQMSISIVGTGIPAVGWALFVGTVLIEFWNIASAMADSKAKADGYFG